MQELVRKGMITPAENLLLGSILKIIGSGVKPAQAQALIHKINAGLVAEKVNGIAVMIGGITESSVDRAVIAPGPWGAQLVFPVGFF